MLRRIVEASINLLNAFYEVDGYGGYLIAVNYLLWLDGQSVVYKLSEKEGGGVIFELAGDDLNFEDLYIKNRFGWWLVSVAGCNYLGDEALRGLN